ncbi:ABC transporter permease [Exiguobacterium sp. S22-S28]|uniref:ABC transporter permease n=1 Tax=Exiguobacterium sp. S22-S28 TaxID=3342768 RepID=UPI00372D555B
MNLSIQRTLAIFLKDVKDVTRNLFVTTTLLVPILLAIVYRNLGDITLEIHYTVINLTFSSVTAFVQCTLIAEEKEKNTLRTLMLSPATTSEILLGKSLLSLLITLITILLCIQITGYVPEHVGLFALAIIGSCLFYLGLGTVLGLITKSVMEASVVVLPIMFLFGFGTMLETLASNNAYLKLLEYLPNLQLLRFAELLEQQKFTSIGLPLLVIGIWSLLGALLAVMVYRKQLQKR